MRERTLTLLLVRHGLTHWNAEGRLQGHSDIPLSPEGREQARKLGSRFSAVWQGSAHQPLLTPPVAIYSSDLSRARETAALIRDANPSFLSEIPFAATPLLRERGFGVWEGLTAAEATERFGPDRSHGNEGEPHATVRERMRLALAQIWEDAFAAERLAATVLVVGHGGSLRHLVGVAADLGPDAFRHFRLSNTGLSVLQVQGASVDSATGSIYLWNDVSHLADFGEPG